MTAFTRRGLAGLLLLTPPGAALAQGAAPRRGPNGGPVVVADGHPIELVLSGTTLTLFVTEENGRPMATARASGRATVQAGGQTATVSLTPAEPNRLVGTLAAPLAAGARVVFNVYLSDAHR
ncbi:MAG: hypothetical protein K2X11_07930, partial [Acetobacteraceae bacterium]|nr:hypothetical protein [Acetobacteraceae bacterium]